MSTSSLPEAVAVTSSEAVAPEAQHEATWPFLRRYFFAALVLFFVLPNFPFPLDDIPGLTKIGVWTGEFWDAVVPAAATRVFHVSAEVKPNGSGDTTYNYVQVALFLAFALAGALPWAIFARRRAHWERVSDYFRIYIRFALAAAMVVYGTIKVIPSQFPTPTLDRLVQPYGSSSPMGVLWTFMGTSKAYNFFTGSAELLGGILLTIRRTTLLGALIVIGAMGNVALLNYTYDVPVKLYSTQLLLEAVILVAPDARRLFSFFILNRAVAPAPNRPLWKWRWLETGTLVVRTLLVTLVVFLGLQRAQESRKQWGDLSPRSPLRGIWNIDELTDNGVSRPPLTTDLLRWRRVVFDSQRFANIMLMNDTRLRYTAELDEKKHTIKLTNRDDPKEILTLAYTRPDAQTLTIDSSVAGHALHGVCHLSELTSKPLLLTRGFHWINEYPFNR